jgi:hypothetical protein
MKGTVHLRAFSGNRYGGRSACRTGWYRRYSEALVAQGQDVCSGYPPDVTCRGCEESPQYRRFTRVLDATRPVTPSAEAAPTNEAKENA